MQATVAQEVEQQAGKGLILIDPQPPYRAGSDRLDRRAVLPEMAVEALDEPGRALVQCVLQSRADRLEMLQRGARGGERERVAHEGSGKVGHPDFRLRV